MKQSINYHNRRFKVENNSDNGELEEGLIFHYKQVGNILTCDYNGKSIVKGNILGTVNDFGEIEMSYHQINNENQITSGKCSSSPEILPNGKIKLHESWQWTSGDKSKGESTLVEV